MADYKKMYFTLFSAVEKAIQTLEAAKAENKSEKNTNAEDADTEE